MTHIFEAETPCETCGQSACGERHSIRVTEHNTACMTQVEKFIGELQVMDVTLTWAEVDTLADLLSRAGHEAKSERDAGRRS